MKTKWIITAAAAALLGFSATVQAVPIQGSIQFNGTGVFSFAGPQTTLTFDNDWAVTTPVPTLDYALVPQGTAVTFKPLVFTGTGAGATLVAPIIPLWTFTIGLVTYSFDLSALSDATVTTVGLIKSVSINGSGTAHKTGFTDTLALWSLSGSGTNLILNVGSQNTTATGVGVPDGGTTVLLLGAALSGLGLLRKKLAA